MSSSNFFQKRAWTTSLAHLCFDDVTSCAIVNDFISTVRKAHTSNVLTTSLAWLGHVDYYNIVVK